MSPNEQKLLKMFVKELVLKVLAYDGANMTNDAGGVLDIKMAG